MRMLDRSGVLDVIKNAPRSQPVNRVDIARAYSVPSSEVRPFLRDLERDGLIMFDSKTGGILPREQAPDMGVAYTPSGSANWGAGY